MHLVWGGVDSIIPSGRADLDYAEASRVVWGTLAIQIRAHEASTSSLTSDLAPVYGRFGIGWRSLLSALIGSMRFWPDFGLLCGIGRNSAATSVFRRRFIPSSACPSELADWRASEERFRPELPLGGAQSWMPVPFWHRGESCYFRIFFGFRRVWPGVGGIAAATAGSRFMVDFSRTTRPTPPPRSGNYLISAHEGIALDSLAESHRANSRQLVSTAKIALRTARRIRLPRPLGRMAPSRRRNMARSAALVLRFLYRFEFGYTRADLLKQRIGSLDEIDSAFRFYACFSELRRAAPCHASGEMAPRLISVGKNTASYWNYVSLVGDISSFSDFRPSGIHLVRDIWDVALKNARAESCVCQISRDASCG